MEYPVIDESYKDSSRLAGASPVGHPHGMPSKFPIEAPMTDFLPELLNSNEALRVILDKLTVGVRIVDNQGAVRYRNPASFEILNGGSVQLGESRAWSRKTGKPMDSDEWPAVRAITRGESARDEEIEIELPDGSRKVLLQSGVPLVDPSGAIVGGLIVSVDITDRVALEDRLKLAVDTDPLTHADSRRRFYEVLTAEMARSNRYQRPLSLGMFDIDRFKEINDRFGHLAGDHVLERISELVLGQLREGAHLSRFGGDEFMVLLPETRLADAVMIVERLRETLSGARFDVVGSVTCSFGVCEYLDEESVDNFIRRADRALYEAKAAGRNCVAAGPS